MIVDREGRAIDVNSRGRRSLDHLVNPLGAGVAKSKPDCNQEFRKQKKLILEPARS
jgi:hypothetical protein